VDGEVILLMKKGWIVLSWLAVALLVIVAALTGGGAAAAQGAAMPGVGEGEIRDRLPVVVAGYLADGGVELAPLPQAEEGVVQFYLFYSETCPHCHDIMDNYLPTVYEKYGDQVEYEYINIYNNNEMYETMLALEQKLGLPPEDQGYVPTLFIGDKVLVGADEIPAKLEGYIDDYLAQGGVAYPDLEDLPPVVIPTPEPTVQILVFVDQAHPDFMELNNLLVGLIQQYPDGLVPLAADITTAEGADTLAQVNEALGVSPPQAGTPQVLIDHEMLVGMDEIAARLPGLVEDYLAQGGVTIPDLESLAGGATSTPPAERQPIYLAYFEQAGCQECTRTEYDLNVVLEEYPQVVVDRFAIEEAENKELNAWLSDEYGVPEEKRLSTPMIFVGQDVLVGTEANLQNLLAAVSKYAGTGAERTWDDFDPEAGGAQIQDTFQRFGVLGVLGAGLIDGLNPCAFATLVFFISYLTFTGRRGRDILFVGLAFALGVFLTYLLVGVGLLKAVQALPFFSSLGRWVYLLTALLCVVLAALTFRDFFRAREGKVGEMTLKLPLSLRRRINKVIREGAQMRAFVAVALVTGFLVSLIELACTGQVYLPTIVYVLSVPELAARAFLYLVLYCLMFILPLVVVFVLAYRGTTSEQLGQFVNRHTATIKLLTGLVFGGLALWMTWTMAPLFGLESPWNWLLLGGVVVLITLGTAILMVTGRKKPPKKVARSRRRSRA
jgi:cytochrome c biogenesis protein CcdA/glutaredoxin